MEFYNTKRLFNKAFFAKIYIDEDDETRERSVRVDYNEPFDSLLSRLIPARVHHTLDVKKTAHREIPMGGPEAGIESTAKVQGSHTDTLVGRRGLEPLTPCASCKCATSCANGPWTINLAAK